MALACDKCKTIQDIKEDYDTQVWTYLSRSRMVNNKYLSQLQLCLKCIQLLDVWIKGDKS